MNIPTVTDNPSRLLETIRLMQTVGIRLKKLSTRGNYSAKSLTLDKDMLVFSYSPTVQPIVNTIMVVREIASIVAEDAKDDPVKKGHQIFGVIIKAKEKKFKFYFDRAGDQERVLQAMAYVVRTRSKQTDEDPTKVRLVELWIQTDVNDDRRLSLQELLTMLDALNIQMSKKLVRNMMAEADADKSGFLDFEEFQNFFARLMQRHEFDDIYNKYTSPTKDGRKEFMKPEELQKFLREAQGETIDVEKVSEIMKVMGAAKSPGFTVSQFCTFLCSAVNGWAMPRHATVYQPMTHPLHHYFMASSHNTYLSGDQLQSQSKIEMYKVALERGCRCVELDCWDGPNGDPIIYHGYTRTSKILFRDVIKCINKYAFTTSSYPVVLSLEIHTSPSQQGVMATVMRDVFQEKLGRFNDIKDIFSPLSLQNRILVKGKMLPGDEDEKDEEGAGAEDIATAKKAKKEEKPGSYNPDLSDTIGIPAKKTKDWGATSFPQNVQSFGESKTDSMAHKDPQQFRNMCCRMFARIYPGGSRVNSSNYNPMLAWTMGAQIVALNYQTQDFPMRLNVGRFKQNGNCGYLLKPLWLRTLDMPMPVKEYDLTVTVLLGSQIPKPNLSLKGETIDPYVQVFITGIPEDTTPTPYPRTATVDNNGFNPFWAQKFKFRIRSLELACITLRVMDADINADDLVAESSLSVESLRLGYRSVPLMNPVTGLDIQYATVLCHFAIADANSSGKGTRFSLSE